MSYRTRRLLGICLLVVLTGAAVIFLAYRSARAVIDRLATFHGPARQVDEPSPG